MDVEKFRQLMAESNAKPARKKQGHEEDDIQTACVRWFEKAHPKLGMLIHHSPNGGKRDARTAATMKKMGTRAGFPDLVLLVPMGGYHGLFIEMKTKKGKQSEYQKEYERLVTEQGYKYCLCRSLEDFMKIIKDYLEEDD